MQFTWGFLSSGQTSDSNLSAVYRPPNPPPSMQTLGLCEHVICCYKTKKGKKFMWKAYFNTRSFKNTKFLLK